MLLFVLDGHFFATVKFDATIITVNIGGPDVVWIFTMARFLRFVPFQLYISARTLDLPTLPLALEFYLFIGVSALAHTVSLQVNELTNVHLAVRLNLCSLIDIAPLPRTLDNCPINIPVHFPEPVRNKGL
jgi:hypothetical protein